MIYNFVFQAHQQSRRADRLLAGGKYEEAISCHKKAAGEVFKNFKMYIYIYILKFLKTSPAAFLWQEIASSYFPPASKRSARLLCWWAWKTKL